MKKKVSLRNILGDITQEELAMLLEISRGQLSMYEIGKRDIPLSAKQKFAELLTNLEKNKTFSDYSKTIISTQKKQAHEWLQKQIKEIEYKSMLIERKIEKVKQVRIEAFKALEVAHYLEAKKNNELEQSLTKTIKSRLENVLSKNNLQYLYELKLKYENLIIKKLKIEEFEKKLLKS